MANYRFGLESFKIETTRASHEDTVYVAFGVKVGDAIRGPFVSFVGDKNDGDYRLGMDSEHIDIQAGTPVRIAYYLLNCGHKDRQKVEGEAKTAIDRALTKVKAASAIGFAGVATGQPGAKPDDNWWWKEILVELVKQIPNLIALLTADCDGPVAFDVIDSSGADIDAHLGGKVAYIEERFYPGQDSPHGCGGNSRYRVKWSVSRA